MTVLLDDNDVADGQAVPAEISGAIQIELLIELVKIHRLCRRCGIAQIIVVVLHR